MFSYEDYYKLYNVPIEPKYQELKHFLEKHAQEMNVQGTRGFRDRMLQYSKDQALYLASLLKIEEKWTEEYFKSAPLKQLEADLSLLYQDVTTDYNRSTCNPNVALSLGGKEIGPALAAFAALFRRGAEDAFTHRRFRLLRLIELYISLHKILVHGQVHKEQLINLYRSSVADGITTFYEVNFLRRYSPSEALYTDIVMEENLTEPYYLYAYGLPVGRKDLLMRRFFQECSDEEIETMSSILVEGFEAGLGEGYRRCNRQLVGLSVVMGTERLARNTIEKLNMKGYSAFVYQVVSSSVNPAYEWDHRCDMVSAVNREVSDSLFQVADKLCEDNSVLLKDYAGDIRIQMMQMPGSFRGHMGRGGRFGFGPTSRLLDEASRLQEIFDHKAAKTGMFEVTSSAVLVLPLLMVREEAKGKEILDQYRQTFTRYLEMAKVRPSAERPQQAMADALDKGSFVYLVGRGNNETDLVFALHPLANPKLQTNFMVNSGSGFLPGGSVHTVPVLSETNGLFHVTRTLLQGKPVVDLRINIEDGYVTDYTYNKEESDPSMEGILRSLLTGKDGMKVSEFSVGTNTEGYGQYVRLSEADRMFPEEILAHLCPSIVIGDTAYEGAEERKYMSPTTHKQMIALSGNVNEIFYDEEKDILEAAIPSEETAPTAASNESASLPEETAPDNHAEGALETGMENEKVQEQPASASKEESRRDDNEFVQETAFRSRKRIRLLLPFEEVGTVSLIKENGDRQDVIREGWFVLIGTDHLNLPLIEWKNELKARQEQNE